MLSRQPTVKLTHMEQERISEIRTFLLQHLDKHVPIKKLALQVEMNESKLKAGFKLLFGESIFHNLLEARMNEAQRLLLQTEKPIKEIASLVGYKYMKNFLTAFRKYFKCTPGSLRKI